MKKVLLSSLFLSLGVCSVSYADTAKNASICPIELKYKTIGMKDMSFK
ncbi:hypothetical protein BBG19_0524 [Francisella sp. MA067296]|nr:hypothetical protein BBG19_0524 [Francisella sp. MA067296]